MGGGGSKSSEEDAMAEFKKFDMDGNASISLPELTQVFRELDPNWTPKQIALLFNAVDANRNGDISLEEFRDWVMADSAKTNGIKPGNDTEKRKSFTDASKQWKGSVALETYGPAIEKDVIRMIFEAGTWANVQVTDPQKGKTKKKFIDTLHTKITDQNILSPGACTQLRDMALACGLLVVAQLRLKGEGQGDAEQWLKRSIEPKPHLVSAKLWRASYDFCWASARHACFVHLSDKASQAQEKVNWKASAEVCFGKQFKDDAVKRMFLQFASENI